MSRKINSATHSEQLLTGVARLLADTTHKHSDVRLQVGGKIFHCHKFILALKSPYFEEKLFPPSLSAAAAAEQIVLSDIRADDFDKMLQFMYIGEMELDEKNVENILRAADLMKLTELTKFCVDYLTDTVSTETCPRYWKIAEQMNLATLALTCKRQCLKELDKIGSSSELSSLSETMMRELLKDDELVVESEVDVCETLMKWLNSQTQSGHSVQPYHLLTLVRWSAVPVEYVKTKLITNNILMRDRRCFEFLSKVISYRLTGVQFNGLNTFHRPSTGVEQCVVLVGVNKETDTFDMLHVSLQRQDHVTTTQAIPITIESEVAACVSGKELYFTGAGLLRNEAWKWESAFGWVRCADMIDSRGRHTATFVNNTSMYVLGGCIDEENVTLDSIEQYSTVTNKWTKVGQLMHATHSAACAVYKTSIYVFGAAGQNDVTHDRVQVFDTATKLCTELTQRLPQPAHLLTAVMWDKSVILINGRTCLIFDLELQTFQQRDQFAAGVAMFGLVLENQRIFIVGGIGPRGQNDKDEDEDKNEDEDEDKDEDEEMIISDEVRSVAVMDVVNNEASPKWQHFAKLPEPTIVISFATMTLKT